MDNEDKKEIRDLLQLEQEGVISRSYESSSSKLPRRNHPRRKLPEVIPVLSSDLPEWQEHEKVAFLAHWVNPEFVFGELGLNKRLNAEGKEKFIAFLEQFRKDNPIRKIDRNHGRHQFSGEAPFELPNPTVIKND